MGMLRKLSVLESALDQWDWTVKTDDKGTPFIDSKVMKISGPREVEFYHQNNCYSKAGVPCCIREISCAEKAVPAYISYARVFSDACCEELKKGNGLLIAGGFCTYDPGIVGGIQRAIGTEKRLGIVWLDAHADIETPEDTHSGIAAGLPLAVISGLSRHLDAWREAAGLEQPILGQNILLSDYHARSDADDRNLKRANINVVDANGFSNPEIWEREVRELAERVDAIYLHVDIDILDFQYVPSYKFPIPAKGQDPETLARNIRTVMNTEKVIACSILDVCFESGAPDEKTTYENGMKIMQVQLENWKSIPEF